MRNGQMPKELFWALAGVKKRTHGETWRLLETRKTMRTRTARLRRESGFAVCAGGEVSSIEIRRAGGVFFSVPRRAGEAFLGATDLVACDNSASRAQKPPERLLNVLSFQNTGLFAHAR